MSFLSGIDDLDGGSSSRQMETEAAAAVTTRTAETVREAAETVQIEQIRQIMGMDSEGTMSDNDGTGAEATAEGFCYEGNCLWIPLLYYNLIQGFYTMI
jgi:hypothetical protein